MEKESNSSKSKLIDRELTNPKILILFYLIFPYDKSWGFLITFYLQKKKNVFKSTWTWYYILLP